jgi:maltooligosyltrehalose trehalohydrolase
VSTIRKPMSVFEPTLGAIVGQRGVTFRTWAPVQEEMYVVFDGGAEVAMTRDPEGYFSAHVRDARPGQRYWFKLDEGLRPDPASRFQPEGPLGPSQIVDPSAYRWTVEDWRGAPPLHHNVFYEVHVGTFTQEGTWRAAEDRLEHLAELGVTTIELMPVTEFNGRFGWGYDGVDLFAPSHLYGTPEDLKHFIDTAHSRGLAVILDVVYNHFGPVGNFLRDFAPSFFGKPGDWGDSINYDGPGSREVRAFVLENAAYWVAEFRFDGLRFDATHGIHDSSDEHIVAEMCAAARAAAGGRNLVLVGESEPQDTRLLRGSGVYRDGLDALWNEDWHHSTFVALTGRREAYFTDYQGTASELASMARHGTLYQGQWYSWQRQPRGGFAMGLPSCAFVSFLENHDQIANTGLGWRLYHHADVSEWRTLTALLLVGPQLPLLFQGVEVASPEPFVYFADHDAELAEAVRKGRLEFLSQFPGLATETMKSAIGNPSDEAAYRACKLRHRLDQRETAWAIALHRDLLHLRRSDRVLSRVGTSEVTIESSAPTEHVLLVRYLSQGGDRLIVANLGDDFLSPMNDPLLAPRPGHRWNVLWSSEQPIYGGSGALPLGEAGRWLLTGRAAAILSLVPL